MENKVQSPAVTEDDVYAGLRKIVADRDKPALNYAVNYARYGIGMSGEMLYVQVLYVLNNLSSWRGDVAKETRNMLKLFVKQNKRKF